MRMSRQKMKIFNTQQWIQKPRRAYLRLSSIEKKRYDNAEWVDREREINKWSLIFMKLTKDVEEEERMREKN